MNLKFRNRLNPIFLGLITVATILLIFGSFRALNHQDTLKVQYNIETLLRNEVNASNPYMMSKTLSDLQQIGLVKCAKLTMESTNSVYYNSFREGRCVGPFSDRSTFRIESINGFTYTVDFERKLNIYSLLLELLIYISLGAILFFSKKYLAATKEESQRKLQVLEIEKKYLSSQARQVTHDVASPLSAIKLVSSLIKNLDPEIQDVLNKSVRRTQEIFEELKSGKNEISPFDISEAIKEVINEKRVLWKNTVDLALIIESEPPLIALGNNTQFKRILSNLLNKFLRGP